MTNVRALKVKMINMWSGKAVCDDTQNLNKTESKTFFRYQIFPIPNPILFPIPNIFNTESDTFFDTKFFRYRIRNYPKNGKSFETEKFQNRNITQNTQNLKEIEPNRIHVSSVYLLGQFALQKLRNFLLEFISV